MSLLKVNLRLLFIVLPVFLSGCGLWADFTTYFNIYYNADQLFTEAEEIMNSDKSNIYQIVEPDISKDALDKIDKVIKKCSAILQFHNDSEYVDEAIIMLGKSFYYRKNYLKSQRKFQELLATQQESEYRFEAEFWLARIEMRNRNYTRGLELMRELREKAIERDFNEVVTGTYIEEIRYYLYREDLDNAVPLLNELIANSDNDELNAYASFKLGDINYDLEDYAAAEKAYDEVLDYDPPFKLEVAALIQYGKSLRYQDKIDDALDLYESMQYDERYAEHKAEVLLEKGITYKVNGVLDKAKDVFVLVDTAHTNTQFAGDARFELGEMFENDLLMYDSAYVYYKKAENSSSSEAYQVLIREKNRDFRKYTEAHKKILDYETQMVYLRNPEEYKKDSAYYYWDSLKSANLEIYLGMIQSDTVSLYGYDTTQHYREEDPVEIKLNASRKRPFMPVLTYDTLKTLVSKELYTVGNLLFIEFNNLDSAKAYYEEILNFYPGSPIKPEATFALGSYYLTEGNTEKADSIFNYVYNNFKNNSIVNAAAEKLGKPYIDLEYDPAEEQFIDAEQMMLEGDYFASVNRLYDIYLQYPMSQFAPKALLTAGYILEEKLSMPDSAASFYDTLASNYVNSYYYRAISQKLGFYKKEKERIKKEREDSLRAIQDSLRQIAIQDSLANLPEEEVKTDTTETAPPDSLSAPQDSLQNNTVPPDSGKVKEEGVSSVDDRISIYEDVPEKVFCIIPSRLYIIERRLSAVISSRQLI